MRTAARSTCTRARDIAMAKPTSVAARAAKLKRREKVKSQRRRPTYTRRDSVTTVCASQEVVDLARGSVCLQGSRDE